ncbi:hypothetical protein LTR27_009377 [Elasticomyces elasticus]|nr:hypothetical protein LTR27_009377 [Elasticomyces elasticus]
MTNYEAKGLYWSAYWQFLTEENFSLNYTGMSVLQYPVGFTALDLTKIRNLTFFAPLGAVMEMVGSPSGPPSTASTDDIMMGYKRLSDTRWACTSVRGEPHRQSTTAILTTRQGPSYELDIVIANTNTLTETEAGEVFSPVTKGDIRMLMGFTLRTREQCDTMTQ